MVSGRAGGEANASLRPPPVLLLLCVLGGDDRLDVPSAECLDAGELALLVLAVGRTGDVDERGRAGLMTPFCSGDTLKLRTLAGGENGLFTTLVGGVPMLGKGGRGCAA
jgi:hypothetical protein